MADRRAAAGHSADSVRELPLAASLEERLGGSVRERPGWDAREISGLEAAERRLVLAHRVMLSASRQQRGARLQAVRAECREVAAGPADRTVSPVRQQPAHLPVERPREQLALQQPEQLLQAQPSQGATARPVASVLSWVRPLWRAPLEQATVQQ
jgi:hypothetical protein